MKFTVLTKPISVNSCYGQNKQGRRYMTDEGKAFKEDIGKEAKKNFPLDWDIFGRCNVSIWYYFKTARNDIDGSNKLILDALQGIYYENDNQVDELHCYKQKDAKSPRIEIQINEIIL